MAGYAELVDQAIQRLLDQCEREREFDLMASFASPLPIAVVTHLLGLPNEPERFRRLGSTIARALDGIWSLGQARTLAAADAELRTTFAELLDRRAADPGNDLVSALVAEQGREITAAELSALVRLLLIAGFETTVNAIGSGMRWLLADREQWELLVEDPERSPAVVEEVLRFDPPVQQTARVASQPTEVGDVLVAKNQWVITLLAAANRDPDVYPEPNRFDITRRVPGRAPRLLRRHPLLPRLAAGSVGADPGVPRACRTVPAHPADRADHHAARYHAARATPVPGDGVLMSCATALRSSLRDGSQSIAGRAGPRPSRSDQS